MPQSITGGRKYPVECPYCQIEAGMPLPTATQVASGGPVGATMRCLSCGRDWLFDVAAATDKEVDAGEMTTGMPTFRRKRDRRRA